jgi:hypothetical protein
LYFALGTIGEKLVAFADEILARFSGGAARGGSQLAEREVQQVAKREAAAILEQRGASAAAREGEELATREAGQAVERKADDLAMREAGEAAEREADDLAMREAREAAERKGERTAQREAGETAEEAAERPAALALARGITTGMQMRGEPIPVVLALLNGLRATYKWIDNFTAEPSGSTYEIYLIGSKFLVTKYLVPGATSRRIVDMRDSSWTRAFKDAKSDDGIIYLARDRETGEILKVGKTEVSTWRNSMPRYVTASQPGRSGVHVELEAYLIPNRPGSFEEVEKQVRKSLLEKGERLRWDQGSPGQYLLGRPGRGVPGSVLPKKWRKARLRWEGQNIVDESGEILYDGVNMVVKRPKFWENL